MAQAGLSNRPGFGKFPDETIDNKQVFMSIHRSLATKGKLAGSRSVLTRLERLAKLGKDGRWKQGESIFGLPKVRTKFKTGAKKKKKEVVAGAEGAAAAPAAGAKGAAAPAAKGAAAAAKPAAKK